MFGKTISDMMIKPGKSPVFDTPASYGLLWRDVEFTTSDNVRLSGWLIEGGTDKVIIQSHFGVQCSRCGFTRQGKGLLRNALWTEDIHFLRQAQYLVQAGYSVLMFDMRNHGNSQQQGWISWGVEERRDIVAAVRFIAEHETYRQADIGLLSICMGQGATVYAYGLEEEMKRFDQVKAMISVQPLTYDCFIKAFGLPAFLVKAGNEYSREKRNIDLTGEAFLPYVKEVSVPTMVIQNRNDPMTDLAMVQRYYDDLQVEKELLWLDLEKKRGAAYAWLGENSEAVLRWFGRYVGGER